MTSEPTRAAIPSGAPDKAAIRAELEATRTAFHQLLDSLSDADWKRRSRNPAWSVRQIMYHIAWVAALAPGGVESAKKGKGFNPPSFLVNPLNVLATRVGARGKTRAGIGRKYDEAHAKMLASLDAVHDDDWQKGVTNFGEYATVEQTFRSVKAHFDEHAAEVRA
jgi:DinB superfamily